MCSAEGARDGREQASATRLKSAGLCGQHAADREVAQGAAVAMLPEAALNSMLEKSQLSRRSTCATALGSSHCTQCRASIGCICESGNSPARCSATPVLR